jgi:hypothetical protein
MSDLADLRSAILRFWEGTNYEHKPGGGSDVSCLRWRRNLDGK